MGVPLCTLCTPTVFFPPLTFHGGAPLALSTAVLLGMAAWYWIPQLPPLRLQKDLGHNISLGGSEDTAKQGSLQTAALSSLTKAPAPP